MDHIPGPFAIQKMGRSNDNIGKKRRAMKKVKRELKKTRGEENAKIKIENERRRGTTTMNPKPGVFYRESGQPVFLREKRLVKDFSSMLYKGMEGASGTAGNKATIQNRKIAKRIAIVRERRLGKVLLEMDLIDHLSAS